MPKFQVVVTDFLEESSIESKVLADIADLTLAQAHDEATLQAKLRQTSADAMILYHDITRVGDATLALAPHCKGLVRAGVGYNNVDLAAAKKRGITVCNVPDYGTEEVADHALMLLLALARRTHPSDRSMRDGTWDYRVAYGAPRLRGKVLGLIGCGRIGTATALRAKAFGLDVAFYDPFVPNGLDKALGIRRCAKLDELLEQSRFVSLHCWLDDSTRHLMNAPAFAKLQPGAFLINTARGGIVDQTALADALASGKIAGAGLDVFEREPFDEPRLLDFQNVVVTPHSAFYSDEGFIELRTKAATEVRRLLLGEPPLNPVKLS